MKPLIDLRDSGSFTGPRGVKAALDQFRAWLRNAVELLFAPSVIATPPMIANFTFGQGDFAVSDRDDWLQAMALESS